MCMGGFRCIRQTGKARDMFVNCLEDERVLVKPFFRIDVAYQERHTRFNPHLKFVHKLRPQHLSASLFRSVAVEQKRFDILLLATRRSGAGGTYFSAPGSQVQNFGDCLQTLINR